MCGDRPPTPKKWVSDLSPSTPKIAPIYALAAVFDYLLPNGLRTPLTRSAKCGWNIGEAKLRNDCYNWKMTNWKKNNQVIHRKITLTEKFLGVKFVKVRLCIFLANVNWRLLYAIARPSICNVYAPYSVSWHFLHHFVPRPSVDINGNFYRDRVTPSSWGLNAILRGSLIQRFLAVKD